MLGHITRHGHQPMVRTASHNPLHTQAAPRLLQRPPLQPMASWGTAQRASYYFDATWHTAQTLRRLIRANLANDDLGHCPPAELLAFTMEALLRSLCPGLPDDGDSLVRYGKLLQDHLGGLEPAEVRQLHTLLTAQHFACAIDETVIDDPMFEKFGCSNGPPNQRMRTLMQTKDLHYTLAEVAQSGERELQRIAAPPLSAAQALAARNVLAAVAQSQAERGVTLNELVDIAARLADAIGLPQAPAMAIAATPLPPVSSVDWQEARLLVDLHTFCALRQTGDPELYAEMLRDLLELLLARRLFGMDSALLTLSAVQRSLLFRTIEHVLSLPPTMVDPAAPATAAARLKGRHLFGTVQIFPTAGVKLGHAAIAPTMSLIPNRTENACRIGTRFMRPGFRLEPTHCAVNEWDLRWLDAKENEALYPAKYAWHLRVPAQRARLQLAAQDIMHEWQRKSVPYRFIGAEPGMPATGCRATVWHAVQRAMDDETRALFEHFRRGLPAPESPTELALRLEQFMDWLTMLAAQPVRADL